MLEPSLVRIGIVGCNYGRLVHLPAFRLDPRCEVVALAGRDAARTRGACARRQHPAGLRRLAASSSSIPDVDAVTIATPPSLQPAIAVRALELGKPVFAEKPMAADLAGAEAHGAEPPQPAAGPPWSISTFREILTWRKAKALLDAGRDRPLAPRHGQLERRELRHADADQELEDTRRRRRRRARQFRQPQLPLPRMVLRPDRRDCRRGCPACPTIRRWRPTPRISLAFQSGAPAASR